MASYNFSFTIIAKGVHFCKGCLCKLSDLKIGGVSVALARYAELSPDK